MSTGFHIPRFFQVVLLCLLLAGCQAGPDPEEHRRTFLTFGTMIDVALYNVGAERAEIAFDALDRYFSRINNDWYAYGAGELARVNQTLSEGRTATLSLPLAALTWRSLEIYQLSEGLFDPTIGNLVKLWGFHDSSADPENPPDPASIQDWFSRHKGVSGLILDGRQLSADSPLILDFGGIAKGTALGEATLLLRKYGIENGLINAGGDLIVLGTHGKRRWRVGIRDPREPKVLRTLALEPGESIVTSGDYERFFTYQGERYHHLLDPRTGYPVTETASVTVISNDPELADAAATALMVGGPSLFPDMATKLGIQYALLITPQGDVLMTPRMQQRLESRGQEDSEPIG